MVSHNQSQKGQNGQNGSKHAGLILAMSSEEKSRSLIPSGDFALPVINAPPCTASRRITRPFLSFTSTSCQSIFHSGPSLSRCSGLSSIIAISCHPSRASSPGLYLQSAGGQAVIHRQRNLRFLCRCRFFLLTCLLPKKRQRFLYRIGFGAVKLTIHVIFMEDGKYQLAIHRHHNTS